MRYLFYAVIVVGLTAGCSEAKQEKKVLRERNLAEWVNPFIGTGGHGHTYPGATTPFGMVQLSPDTRLDGWDGCSGYHYTDSVIYGFSHTHLQGTGVSDYGDLLFMPTNNEVHTGENWGERYRSAFRKETEYAHAGYYKVHLDDHNLTAELTSTPRVGIHKYTFDSPDSCVLFIDLEHRDELVSYSIEPIGDSIIVGFRRSKAWAEDQIIYFAAHFSMPFEFLDQTYEIYYEENEETGALVQVMADVAVFPLRFGVVDSLLVNVALSPTSIDGALLNLETEAPYFDFSRYRADAEAAWNAELGKIDAKIEDKDEKTIFYTALYHTFTVPNLFNDVDGSYRGTDNQIHQREEGKGEYYTIFSLWDTFRATHPLYTILQRERTLDFIQSMLTMHQQMGQLPVWELAGNETGCMIGYHSVPVIVDAYMKGITEFDTDLALVAMQKTALTDELGKKPFGELGYIPAELEHESVSKTLEYAYDDWCIARFAESIGADQAIVDLFDRRSLGYRNLYNPESGFIQPRRGGSFVDNFDPAEVNFNYTEANGWQYNFFAPHDVNGHIDLIGGDEAYQKLLLEMFKTSSVLKGREQSDITGLIGQYAHGNEPSHHMAYLFPFVGEAWRTQEIASQIKRKLYLNAPDGLSGNEDCGQMSAWYVFSALGFYPVTPGSDVYILSSPRHDEATIHLENGQRFTIRALRESKDQVYVQSITLNGQPYTKSYIRHSDIMNGGTITFYLGSLPNREFAIAEADRPEARVNDSSFVAVPFIKSPRSFKDSDSLLVAIGHISEDAEIFYRVIENGKAGRFEPFVHSFPLKGTSTIEAYAKSGKLKSATVSSEVVKITSNRSIQILSKYDNQYAAGGDMALIDGIKGGANFKTGEWQGFFGGDVEFVVDLGEVQTIKKLSLGALQDIKPWIWCPKEVQYSTSIDGENFTPLKTVKTMLDPTDYTIEVFRFVADRLSTKGRFVKAKVINAGPIPDWHLGAGQKRWTFLDEIEIEASR